MVRDTISYAGEVILTITSVAQIVYEYSDN